MTVDVGTHTHTDVDVDVEEFSGWYCIKTDPFPCPAVGCNFVAEFVTAWHHILLWPEKDDLRLLRFAEVVKSHNRNPQIIEYKDSYGPAISYYEWELAGSPVHATKWKESP